MAHRRDYRRRSYYEAVGGLLGDDFASASSPDGLDQVLYHPRELIVAPSRDAGANAPVDEKVLARVAEAVKRTLGVVVRPQPVGVAKELNVRVFSLPRGAVRPGERDALTVAAEVARASPDLAELVAPEGYALTQQIMQPGDDPSLSGPVTGLAAPAARARRPRAGAGGAPGAGVRVAVVDTGVDPPALDGSGVAPSERHTRRDVDTLVDTSPAGGGGAAGLLGPAAGHGTFIAGLVHLVAPGATIHSYKVSSPMGIARERDIAAGVARALDGRNRADVISLSLGGYPFGRAPSSTATWPALREFPILEAAIARVPDDVALVAAAGNCGSGAPFYPAAFDRVIGVAALDRREQLWDQSNYGPWVKACTRGVELRSVFVKGDENPAYVPGEAPDSWADAVNFASWTGTSFAAPLVAAQIAVVLAAHRASDHAMTAREAADLVLAISKPHPEPRGCGRRVLVDLPGQT